MKLGRWRRTDGAAVWLVAASLCVLAGHAPVQWSGAADREALAALSNPLLGPSSRSSSSNTGTGSDLFVPVILTASGAGSSYYTSELTLTNRGSQTATLQYTYKAAAGGGNGTAAETLAPGRQKIVPNAIDYLRTLGIPIPSSGNRIGTLRVGVSGSSDVGVTVRTTTRVADGRAGLAYPGVAVADGFTEAVYLCGLRQNRQDRSNVAFQNMGVSGNITLRTTVYSGDPEAPGSHVMRDVTLAPGGFRQLNGILATAGFSQGYVKVERVSGTAPFYAYGVINDQANSDGSFVFPVTASSLEGVRGLTLPVVIEHPNFSTELILTNFSNSIKSVDVHFVADAIGTPNKTATVKGDLIPPGGQAIIPDAVQMLRRSGAEGIGPRGRTIAGAAFFTAPVGDLSGVVIGARTGSPGGGGQYSVFYNAVPYGAAFDETAWIDALQQNRENRSNLALVNTGEADDSPSVFQLDLYDGATGLLANTVTGLRVAARGWRQINGILDKYAPGTTQGYVRIQKISGNNPFLAYGVINDGGAPGQRSGDGAYLPASGASKGTDDPGGDPPGTSPATDRAALVALYEATDGLAWNDPTNWLSAAPLGDWFGVDTNGSGRVTRLALPGNRLSGAIPPVLGQLSYLERLDMQDNQLRGSIPPELEQLSQLRLLNLSRNQLSGTIPPELALLSQLQWLHLGDNQLYGTIPSELGQLPQLQWLYLLDNQLSGTIPPELEQLSQLRLLNLSRNQLSGTIPPELALLSQLQSLHLGDNQLYGTIPPELGGLTQLQWLMLDDNHLIGTIPPELGQLSQLRSLDLSRNLLSGTIPLELGQLSQLQSLDLSRNLLSGTVPPELGGLTQLQRLTLNDNQLYGTIPPELGQLSRLQGLDLSRNLLSDTIPPELLNLLNLENLYFARNDGICAPGTSAFIAWLGAMQNTDDKILFCNESDVAVLEALHESTNGENWTRSDGWPDGAVHDWYGVSADPLGRVITLDLSGNGLSGKLPAALGNLSQLTELRLGDNRELAGRLPLGLANLALRTLHYDRTSLCAPSDAAFNRWLNGIPSHKGTGVGCALPPSDREILEALFHTTDGGNWTRRDNWLTDAPLGEWYGVTTDADGRVARLDLGENQLSGPIPAEFGGLANLTYLDLTYNRLNGPIPTQFGGLAKLEELWASESGFSGPIPPELGNLVNLEILQLRNNGLSGSIPPELGSLSNLRRLALDRNDLTGPIPPELGDLSGLNELWLHDNDLTGPLPPALGNLEILEVLFLDHNDLTGPVPPEFRQLSQLRELRLTGNAGLSGVLPPGLTDLRELRSLMAGGTGLCAPSNAPFLDWLEGVRARRVALCDAEPAMAYLIQSVQSREFPVPLVAGERALLRVFVTAQQAAGEGIPDVRARFYRNDREVHVENIPGKLDPIPTEVDESSLSKSANAEIPGDLVQPGLEMVIEIDPEGMIDPELGVVKRIPETGRLAVEVRSMPLFDLTIVPFIWTEAPDSTILEEVEAVVADPDGHPSFSRTRTWLPVGDFEVTAHDPVESASNNAYDLLRQTDAIWAMEGRRGHYYMGTMSGPVTGPTGVAYVGGRASFSPIPDPTALHELGHNMSLGHAPCGNAGGPDPSFPTTDASIGVWGFDFRAGGLVPPAFKDLMSYCDPDWISDYHFTNALRYRLFRDGATRAASIVSPARSMLLWGGVGADSIPYLEPAFLVDAPAALPDSAGPYRLTGHSGDGAELFSFSFAMPEVADGDGGSGFAFVLPVQPEWEQILAGITLSGPGGSATLDENTDQPMAILRDPQSGRVRGFLRDPPPPEQAGRDGARVSGVRGLEVIRSRGLPDAAAWQR